MINTIVLTLVLFGLLLSTVAFVQSTIGFIRDFVAWRRSLRAQARHTTQEVER